MNILALDTSTDHCSVAVYNGACWHTHAVLAGQTHSQCILPMVEAVLAQAALGLPELKGIAFGAGPGSFTGLRIACGVAQGLAFAAKLPVIGISTLEAMAQTTDAQQVIACLDARMNEVYHAAYVREADGRWKQVSEPGVFRPEAVPALEGTDWIGVGSGFAAYAALAQSYRKQLRHVITDCVPTARAIGELALPRLRAGGGVRADLAVPLYIRNKIALTTAEQRGASS
jgi:tRNA threonylcarbamoyladenosine biosynthesis protein TsaB